MRNAWGSIVSVEKDGRLLPVMCGCGGSMWLCPPCADKIREKNENVMLREDALALPNVRDTTPEWPNQGRVPNG